MKLRQRGRTRPSLSTKGVFRIAASFCFLLLGTIFIGINLLNPHNARALSAGDYRSKASGAWSTASNWEKYNGLTWATALTAPSSTDGVIEIQSGHTMTVSANVTVDQVVVDAGGTLTISNNTVTVNNGTGNDIDISGTMNLNGGTLSINSNALVNISSGGVYTQNGGTETTSAGWAVNNGGTYVHNVDAQNIPVATWGTSSTLKITGVISNSLKGTYQDFGNVVYNCTGQTCCPGMGNGSTLEMYDNFKTIAGDFTVLSTGSGGTWLFRSAGTAVISGKYIQTGGTMFMAKGVVCTLTVNGDFNLSGGTFVLAERYSCPTLNVYGNMNLIGGTLNHSTYLSNIATEGIGTVNLYGNYINTGVTHTETATLTGHGEFNFTRTGTQTFSISGTGSISNLVNFTVVSGAVVDMSTYVLTGAGTFTLQSGGGLMMASPDGITASTAKGNIQVTGTRSYSTGADYTYYSTSGAQVTGNGLPATVHNITFNNSYNVTLTGSSSATNIITLTSGKVITGSNELGTTNTSTSSIVGYTSSQYVVGNLRRSVSASGSYDYPVGDITYYEPANISLTSMTGFTSIVGSFIHTNPIDPLYPLDWNLRINGSRVLDILNYGYWILTPDASMSGGTYAVTLNEQGHSNPAPDPRFYGVLKRPNATSYWTSIGTHTNSTQSEVGGVATAVRSDLAAFSHFVIGIGEGILPITLVQFDAKPAGKAIELTWTTANEVNNDYFTIERSVDGRTFKTVKTITGAGNSTRTLHYTSTDDNPIKGVSYYRLKQTDFDGKTTYSSPKSVRYDEKATDEVTITSVGPNPFSNEFTLNYSAESSGSVEVMVVNSSGTVITRETITAEKGANSWHFVNNTAMQAGIYYAVVVMNGKRVSQKLIKS